MEINSLHILGYIGALIIGIVLGLVGSGGSILAVPIFTYLFHFSPIMTTSYSMFVIGTTSSVGVIKNYKKGFIDFKLAMAIAVPSIIMVYYIRRFAYPFINGKLISIGDITIQGNKAILLLFAFLMLFASISMIKSKKHELSPNLIPQTSYLFLVGIGIVLGVLSGLAGIGGGFMIIPVLVLIIKLPMKNAVATSLFIISIKSLLGFTGDLGMLNFNWRFLFLFTIISLMGILLGIYLSRYIKSHNLKKSFGWLVLFMAIGMIYKEVYNSINYE